MNVAPPDGGRPERNGHGRRVPGPVLAARAQQTAFERIVTASPACCGNGPYGPPEALTVRLAAHPRLRARMLARLRDEVGDPRAFADAVTVRDATTPDGATAGVLAGLLLHVGSFGPAFDRDIVAVLRATFGASATTFALRHAAVSPPRSDASDLSDPGLADRVAADGLEILAAWWHLSFGPAARWLAAPSAAEALPLLSGEAVGAIASAVTSHLLAEADGLAPSPARSAS